MSEAQMDSIPLMSQVAISGHLNSVESAVSFNYETLSEQTTCTNIYNKDAETTEGTAKILFCYTKINQK